MGGCAVTFHSSKRLPINLARKSRISIAPQRKPTRRIGPMIPPIVLMRADKVIR